MELPECCVPSHKDGRRSFLNVVFLARKMADIQHMCQLKSNRGLVLAMEENTLIVFKFSASTRAFGMNTVNKRLGHSDRRRPLNRFSRHCTSLQETREANVRSQTAIAAALCFMLYVIITFLPTRRIGCAHLLEAFWRADNKYSWMSSF
jgi:hypothetical protein